LDALIRTLHRTPLKYEATVVTKNKLLIKNLTSNLHTLEDKNWMDVAHGDLMRSLVETLRRRTGRTHLFLYNHGRHHAGMNTATNMAKEACRRRLTEYEKVKTASDLSLEGARFMALSQADLYQNIRRIKKTKKPYKRRKTAENLDQARWSAFERTKKFPRDRDIWLAMRNKAISREISQFLFKACHGAYKIGDYWEKIPNYEQRSVCKVCDTTETMEHILFGCDANGQRTVWELAKSMWLNKHDAWPEPNIGTVLSCGIADF
ncbi:hypothetical protein K525DRAFT_175015, partial [Schizophyllum commune Loenen D]